MQVLIHAEISEHVSDIRFHKALIEWSKKENPSIVTFDFDNLSERTIVNYGIDLAKQADRILVIIDVNEGKNLGGIIHFMDQLSRLNDKRIRVVINGEHPQLNMIAKAFGNQCIYDLDLSGQQKIVKEFLSRRQAA